MKAFGGSGFAHEGNQGRSAIRRAQAAGTNLCDVDFFQFLPGDFKLGGKPVVMGSAILQKGLDANLQSGIERLGDVRSHEQFGNFMHQGHGALLHGGGFRIQAGFEEVLFFAREGFERDKETTDGLM